MTQITTNAMKNLFFKANLLTFPTETECQPQVLHNRVGKLGGTCVKLTFPHCLERHWKKVLCLFLKPIAHNSTSQPCHCCKSVCLFRPWFSLFLCCMGMNKPYRRLLSDASGISHLELLSMLNAVYASWLQCEWRLQR